MTGFKAKVAASEADAELMASLLAEVLDPPPAVSTSETADGWQLELYVDTPPETALLDALADGYPQASALRGLHFDPLPETDWVALTQKGLHPVEAGRFLIHGSHDRHRVANNAYAIEIEAGQAFGTAHHGTTRGCLMLIDDLAGNGPFNRILDLGSGSGILAIAAAKSLGKTVIASDIDPVAVQIASENTVLNGVDEKIQTVVAEGVEHPVLGGNAPYEVVMANILAGPLITLAPGIAKLAKAGTYLILSGLLDEQASEVSQAYQSQGFAEEKRLSLEGWTSLLMRKN